MGIGDWLDRAWYDVKDVFSRSEAEEARDNYKKLIEDIKYAIGKIDEWMGLFDYPMKGIHRGWVGLNDDSFGRIIEVFEDKRLVHYRKYDNMLMELCATKDELRARLQRAEDISNNLRSLCNQEDEEMRKRSKEEITYE